MPGRSRENMSGLASILPMSFIFMRALLQVGLLLNNPLFRHPDSTTRAGLSSP